MFHLLKIAVKSLATTARYFKLEEHKALAAGRLWLIISNGEDTEFQKEDKAKADHYYNIYQNLRARRKNDLRKTARTTNLAYGFLRGKKYKDIELFCYEKPDFNQVGEIALTYFEGDKRDLNQRFEEWRQEAIAWLKEPAPLQIEESKAA